MGSLLIVTGPPGSGKSTISRLLADNMQRSVLVEGDLFFAFLAAGAIAPWLPESMEQNHVVGDAAAAATRRFMADYDTVYDGVIGPWDLDRFVRALGTNAIDYAILLPSVDVCVERVSNRTDHGFNDHSATRHMHGQFADAVRTGAVQERHVIDSGAFDLAALTGEIERHRSAGDLRLG
jgi:cytidylate kinase